MRVLHFAPLDNNRASGLNHSIPELIRSQRDQNVEATLIATGACDVSSAFPNIACRWYKANGLDVKALIRQSDLLVFHSTYIRVHVSYARLASRLGVPYVITPRGGMTRGAAQSSRLKKWLADRLFYKNYVRCARALHCLTEQEAMQSRHWHPCIFVVGNGVDLPDQTPHAPSKVMGDKRLVLVFIGRLSIYHKGLDCLLHGLAAYCSSVVSPNVEIHLHGPSERGSQEQLLRLVSHLKLQKVVSIRPPSFGSDKKKILQHADGFIMTSRFEGHPMAALEALSYGLPCLLTDGTNIADEVESAEAGWRIKSLSEKSVSAALAQFVATSPEHKAAMSLNARSYAAKFSWDVIANRTVRQYQQLIDDCYSPTSV